jgi:hypothetical protein
LKVAQIGEEDRRFDDVIESESFGSQNRCDIIQHAACLRGDVAGDNLARFGVERDLAAAKEEPSAAHRLRVGPIAAGASLVEMIFFMRAIVAAKTFRTTSTKDTEQHDFKLRVRCGLCASN